ncbi:MAG: tetratricopeptide repeat protein [Candidatus Heimdallarchaeota archaeon]
MQEYQELYRLQSSLSGTFDRMGLTQELQGESIFDEFTTQEREQVAFLIEKFENRLAEVRSNLQSVEEILDQRLLVRLGNYYHAMGEELTALDYYDLSNMVEENEWALFNTGRILYNQDDLEGATQRFEEAIKIKPEFPQAFRYLGLILFRRGDKEEALNKLKHSQKLNPNDLETNKILAEYFLEQGEKKEALSHLKAIHYRDEAVTEKIEELERRKSLFNRLKDRLRGTDN